MSSISIDKSTIEKAIASSVINLYRAYTVGDAITPEEGKILASSFLKGIIKNILQVDPDQKSNVQIQTLRIKVDNLIEEYKPKQDKAYVALLKLREELKS